jgi:drug/metabolite transporter (DMT)-like permease
MTASEETGFDRARRAFGQIAYGGVVLGLCGGVGLHFFQQRTAASVVLALTCGLLMTVPAVNLLAVLVEEVRRRDWAFAALAAAVLALIGYAVMTRI